MPKKDFPKTKVFIYNVSKKLVREKNSDRIVSFKYANSSDGYANFVVSADSLSDSSNPKFYNIVMPINKTMRLNYKDDGEWTSITMTPQEIKNTFELSRYPKGKQSCGSTPPASVNRERGIILDNIDNEGNQGSEIDF